MVILAKVVAGEGESEGQHSAGRMVVSQRGREEGRAFTFVLLPWEGWLQGALLTYR